MPNISAELRILIGIIAALAGILSAAIGNVLAINIAYFFTRRGRRPKPRPIRLWSIFYFSAFASVILGGLATFGPSTPEAAGTVTPTSEPNTMDFLQLKQTGAYIKIISVSTNSMNFKPGDEVPVIASIEYNLPASTLQPALQLKYLQTTNPIFTWQVIQQKAAEVGIHKIQLSGKVKVPELSDLNGEPFQISVAMIMLEEGTGQIRAVAEEKFTLKIEP